MKRNGFNYNIFDLPFTSSSAAQRCSTSEECSTKSRQPPSGAASCCWYAQDTQDQPRYASLLFKGRPDKDTRSQRRNAATANVGTTVSSLVMILFSGDEGFFELKNRVEWKNTVEFASAHSWGVYISTNDIVKGKLIKRTPWLLQPS